MKGVNLKKIGAIVAGATILASSVAFAGLMYQNTELVDANGQPVAKVVLGSGAAASDGAVAGAIAAKLASSAFAKKTLTAAVAADASCSTTASGGTGSCAVSNKKVTLEVTVPGAANAGVHEFATLIGDYIDRELSNRVTYNAGAGTGTDFIDNYPVSEAETDADANPFADGAGTGFAPGDENMYKVGSKSFAPFAAKTVTDPSSGSTYTEEQNMYIKGTTEFSSADNAVEANPSLLVYQVKFDESTHTGVPVCTEANASSDAKFWAGCGVSDSTYTGKHRVKVSLLGSDWIITEMTPVDLATAPLATTDLVAQGGEVKLAKESMYGITNVGDSLTSTDGQLKVRLDDISTPVGADQTAPAIVSFIDANGNVISQDQIMPGSTVKKTLGGKTYKIRVYQTAPGYTFGAKWAEMAMLEQELDLKDGEALDSDLNQDWNVNLMWKNKEASTGTGVGDYTQAPDALRSIVLYKSAFGNALLDGDTINVVEDPVAYKLTYNGLDLTSAQYDTLKYSTGGSVTLSMDAAGVGTCPLLSNEYIKLTSNADDAFKYATGKGKEMYYVLVTHAAACSDGATAVTAGHIMMKKSGSTKYEDEGLVGAANDLQYKTAGSMGTSADGGAIVISGVATPTIALYEDVGKILTTEHNAADMSTTYTIGTGFQSTAAVNDKITWTDDSVPGFPADVGYTSGSDYDEGKFVSPRGSKFDSMTTTSVQFKIASVIGQATYDFATVEAAATGASTTQLVLTEGQTGNVGDVTIKATAIDVTVGACTATGGSATCTVPKDQISAVIMPNNAASVDAVVPYAVNPKLVVLDKDASATTTGVLITVGGDKVNSVTADAMAGAGIDFTATPVVVKQVGNKIIVAGATAQDTVSAGDQFLAAVQAQ